MKASVIGIAAAVAPLTACGSGSSVVVRSPRAPLTTDSSAPTSTVPSTTATSSPAPAVTVTPATGLQDRQVVRVDGTGFTPGELLEVIECAQHGTSTGAGDCNLTGMVPVTADPNGRVTVELTVLRGPFGGNNVVCSQQQPCLISVTQASLSPSQEADTTIEFAATAR